MAKVEIRSSGPARTTKVFVDGREVTGITQYALQQGVGTLPQLLLDIVVTELILDADQVEVEARGHPLVRPPRQLPQPVSAP